MLGSPKSILYVHIARVSNERKVYLFFQTLKVSVSAIS